MQANEIGAFGEMFAAKKLKRAGMCILQRNYRTRLGEIDIIAQDGAYIAFIEVKTRSADSWYAPVQAVDYRKQKRLILSAQLFLQQNPSDLQPRFDVFEVFLKPKSDPPKILRFEHLAGAFDAGGLA